jgi:hypothetical protein
MIFKHSVWKVCVISCDKVLRHLACFLTVMLVGGVLEFLIACGGISLAQIPIDYK